MNILIADIHVAFINASTVVTDAEVIAAINGLETQVHRDFAPAWGINANLGFVPKGVQPEPGWWWIVILDDSDMAGALGYHDTTSEGLPLGKVFAKTDKQYGVNWTGTASHELLEMLADPEINLTVFVQNDANTGVLYAYEVCDACENDGYVIAGTEVSDFVMPAWFEPSRGAGTQFDFLRRIGSPLHLRPGGYIGVFNVTAGQGWSQLNAQSAPPTYEMRPPVGSRRERRKTPRNQWLRSVPK
ncbi:MAG: hypothetical protein ACYDAE_21600 [Steroidobacteraceae bacterium]